MAHWEHKQARFHSHHSTWPRVKVQGRGVAAVADLGGSIITGIDGNPLATLVKQMGVNMLDIRTDTPLFMTDGSEADKALDQAVGDKM